MLAHILGLDNASGCWYLFWSGFGADISELAIVGAIVGLLRKHNCHARRCWRIGRFTVAGTAFVVCGRHHPDPVPTAADISAAGAP